jgi:Arc/MetJ-type ribon-helix-helix transcriptional regulator
VAALTSNLSAELEAFAAPLVATGEFSDTADVLHAAMTALLRKRLTEEDENRLLEALAEEGEVSGDAEGDVIGRVCDKIGLRRPDGF